VPCRWGMPNSQQGSNAAEAGPRADGADEGWDDADGAQPDITSLTPEERVSCCCNSAPDESGNHRSSWAPGAGTCTGPVATRMLR
jgi:hypothetical protein